ncbi:MAG: hypothetical protein US20_C0023G0020 [Candidatus Pacebacteria bacterium GW2011_GWF1_36_5]|nr:MAG: hypothetical protein US20_C0023G0020 [Candidatus Pacebacteria bacterium GW2011_GWF1_36_5]
MKIILSTSDETDNGLGIVSEYVEQLEDRYFYIDFLGNRVEITEAEFNQMADIELKEVA